MDKKKKHVKRKINYKRIAIEQTNYGKVTRYIVYGTHLNIEGNIEIKEETDNIENAQIVAKDISGNEKIIDTEYEYRLLYINQK